MQLHHQAVFDAQARHFDQHVRGETRRVVGGVFAAQRALENRVGGACGEWRGRGRADAVIGRRCAHLLEERAAIFQRVDETAIVVYVNAADLAQRGDVLAPRASGRVEIHDGVGAKRRDDAAMPTGRANRLVLVERIGCRVSRAERFDVEPVVQTARAKLRRREFLDDLRVDGLRGLAGQFLFDVKDDAQFVRQPHASWRAAKEMKVVGKRLPDFAVIALHRGATPRGARDAQLL